MTLPGWNSVQTTTILHNFFELGGIILFLIVVAFELLAYFYGHRKDWLVEESVRIAAIERQQVEEETQRRHDAEIGSVRQQLSEAGTKVDELQKQQAADHSVKKRMRDLLAAIDPQILRHIDAGETTLTIRMQPSDIRALQLLIIEADNEKLLEIKGFGGTLRFSTIMNGSLGPSASVPEQTQVQVEVSPMLRGQ